MFDGEVDEMEKMSVGQNFGTNFGDFFVPGNAEAERQVVGPQVFKAGKVLEDERFGRLEVVVGGQHQRHRKSGAEPEIKIAVTLPNLIPMLSGRWRG